MDEETLHETVTALVKKENYDEALGVVETFIAEHDLSVSQTVAAFVEQGYIYYR